MTHPRRQSPVHVGFSLHQLHTEQEQEYQNPSPSPFGLYCICSWNERHRDGLPLMKNGLGAHVSWPAMR